MDYDFSSANSQPCEGDMTFQQYQVYLDLPLAPKFYLFVFCSSHWKNVCSFVIIIDDSIQKNVTNGHWRTAMPFQIKRGE
jgi:hypothetical protein